MCLKSILSNLLKNEIELVLIVWDLFDGVSMLNKIKIIIIKIQQIDLE